MKKPVITVIDDEPLVRELAQDILKDRFIVETHEDIPDNEPITDSAAYILDLKIKENCKRGIEIAKRIREEGLRGARILHSSAATKEDFMQGSNEGLFEYQLEKGPSMDALNTAIERLRIKGELHQKFNLGIIGLGHFGVGVLMRSLESDWIDDISVFSDYYTSGGRSYKQLNIDSAIESPKIKWKKNLEELTQDSLDAIFLASGLGFKEDTDRNALFEGTADKIIPILYKLKELQTTPLIIGSNPIEASCYLAKEIGVDKRLIIGESVTDTVRARKLLAGVYQQMTGETLDPNRINIPVIGTHEKPIPLFELATYNGETLTEKLPTLKNKVTKNNLRKKLWKKGKKTMMGARHINGYNSAPEGAMEILYALAHFIENPRSCWTMCLNEGAGFVSYPISLSYNPNSDLPFEYKHGNPRTIDPKESELFTETVRENAHTQIKLAKEYLEQHGRKSN